MIRWITDSRNTLVLRAGASLVFIFAVFEPPLFSAGEELALFSKTPTMLSDEGYTINFNNISILEFIRFVGKISNTNFIYNEADLPFTVTVLSEEPTKSADVMAALIQVLRINGLSILEIDNNLLIHRGSDVNQVATIVPPEGTNVTGSAIVTRLFRLKNTSPAKIAALLTPMLSKGALIETDEISHLLIITDVSVSVDRVAQLLTILDTPQSFLEIDAYSVKNALPASLITLATQIILPISEGNPFILVPQPDTMTIFIISTPHLIERTLALLHDLDIPPATNIRQKISEQNIEPSTQFYIYHVENLTIDGLSEIVQETLDELKESRFADPSFLRTLGSMQAIPLTNSLLFTGDPKSITMVGELLRSLDIPETGQLAKAEKPQFFLYKLQNVSGEVIEKELRNLGKNLQGSSLASDALVKAINNIKWVKETNSLLLTGTPDAIAELKALIGEYDVSRTGSNQPSQFLLYKPTHVTTKELEDVLKELVKDLQASGLSDPELIHAISSMHYIKATDSLLFTAAPAALDKLHLLLTSLDNPDAGLIKKVGTVSFVIYKVRDTSGAQLMSALESVASELEKSGSTDKALIESLKTMRYLPDNNSILFTGDQPTLEKAQALAEKFDVTTGEQKATQFLIYKPHYMTTEQLRERLDEMINNLEKAGLVDAALIQAIRSMRYVKNTDSLVFTASPDTLEKLQALLTSLDNPESGSIKKVGTLSFVIYKVKNTSGTQLMGALQSVAGELEKSGSPDKPLIESLKTMRYLPDNDSILFTGDQATLEKVEALAEKFDVSTGSQKATQFLIYKPRYLNTDQLREGLKDMIHNLEEAGLADPALIQAINSMRYAENTDSLVFTASPETLEKVKVLISTIDIPLKEEAKVQRVGETTFLIYKIRGASAPQLIAHLKTIASELGKQNFPDKKLIQTINNLRYIQETNSILFIGDDPTLEKVQKLAEKFDIPGTAPAPSPVPPAESFAIYKPRYQTGPELLNILCNFKENLILSGVSDPGLFAAIDNLKWIDQTSSILIAGDNESITKVQDLLKQFDLPGGMTGAESLQPMINNTSFLVYKLQYHQGTEILTALKQVALELKDVSNVNQDFLTAVNSLQWIVATNSLIASGTQDTLARLKELIGNLDLPLRQVFIEVLMIETTIADALTYGLEWAAGAKYRKKFGAGMSNSPEPPLVSAPGPDSFITNFTGINAANTPTGPAQFPLGVNGFDLGVIGDIIFHKGQSFISLGALVNALQTQQDSTIVLNQKIITQDNRNSTIFVGQNLPYTGSIVTTVGGASQQTSANIEYRDIGVSLSITPTLGDQDIITLDIDVEDTEAPNFPNGSTSSSSVQGIATSKTTMTTRVHVPDQHFLVLSGQMRDTTTHGKQGLPCLGGLPVIGAAFSVTNDTKSLSNVIIFVRPHIINTTEDYKKVTQTQEDLYRSQANEENFDAGIDLVKKPEDE